MRPSALLSILLLAASSPDGFAADEHEHDRHHAETAEPTVSAADLEEHGVRIEAAGSGTVDAGIELPAEVRPNADRLAHVAPRFTGIVRKVNKHVGDPVRAGEVLAVIESDKLAPFELRATFDGTVLDKHVVPGEAVVPGRAAYIIADLSEVWVNVAVYQKALPEVRLGRHVSVSAAGGGPRAEGVISYISPIVDQATRTATARVVLPNDDGAWRPGTFAVATLALTDQAGVVVPLEAIRTLDGEEVVFVVEGDVLAPRAVTVGRRGRTRAEIRDGLSPGERFVAQGAYLVKSELSKSDDAHHAH